MPHRILEIIMKPGTKFWQAVLFVVATIALFHFKDLLEYAKYRDRIHLQKEADLEVLQKQREADSLREVLAGIQRAKEAEAAINALVKTEEITDRLAIDVKALRAHVVKVHNHVALENGEIPNMSIYAEGMYLKETPSVRQNWRNEPMPMGFIRHISEMLPAAGVMVSPYSRFRYVPDIALDSGFLAGPISQGILIESGVKSVLTFWITTTKKGEIFFLNVAYGQADPMQDDPNILIRVRAEARAIARELETL